MTQRRDGADVNALWPLDATPHTPPPTLSDFSPGLRLASCDGNPILPDYAKWRRALCYRCASGFRGCETRIDALGLDFRSAHIHRCRREVIFASLASRHSEKMTDQQSYMALWQGELKRVHCSGVVKGDTNDFPRRGKHASLSRVCSIDAVS